MSTSLSMEPLPKAETVHFFESMSGDFIIQEVNCFRFKLAGVPGEIRVPMPQKLVPFRISRLGIRLARLDMGYSLPVDDKSRIIIFYLYSTYLYDITTRVLKKTGVLDFRNPLHLGVATSASDCCYFGQYRANPENEERQIYASDDSGESWHIAYTFPRGSIWHVHAIHQDPYEDRLWVTTGDYDGQCKLITTDDEFKTVEVLGDGSQNWRAVSLLFTEDRIVWGMDSPLSEVYVVSMDRKTGKITKGQSLPGPVWFAKTLKDNRTVLQTSVERKGQSGVRSRSAKLFKSVDLDNWVEVASFRKDDFSHRYFRNGVIGFSAGTQSENMFTMHGIALTGIDGRAYLASLESE